MKAIDQPRRQVRETQPLQFQPTPSFVTLFGEDLGPASEDHIRQMLASTKMQQVQVSLGQLDLETALKSVVDHLATARQLLLVAHSENWAREHNGTKRSSHRVVFSAERREVMLTEALLRHLRQNDLSPSEKTSPKLMIHLLGCEAGVLRSQISRSNPIWKFAYVLLYSSKKTTSLDASASSLSAAIRYADFCDQTDRALDPFKLFYIAGIHRSECMTLMGGDLEEPLVWHAPKSVRALADLTSIAMLSGCSKDLRKFQAHAKRLDAQERAMIPAISLRELLSSRIGHDDQDGVNALTDRHPELLHAPSITGLLPLGEAIERRHMALLEDLLDQQADPNAPDKDGDTALMVALKMGEPAAIPLLLKHGARSDLAIGGYSVLEQAVLNEDGKTLSLLLRDGLGYSRAGLEAPLQLAKSMGNAVFEGMLQEALARAD
jgi:Ankyrin repeats (3 copies)